LARFTQNGGAKAHRRRMKFHLERGMKATDLVLTQHREVEQLFEQLENESEGDKKGIREELAQNLVAHAVMEEEHLYPAMKNAIRREIEISYVEHATMAYALSQLLATRPGDDTFQARLHVLKVLVTHHMRQEESEVLKKAESVLGNERLMRLGEEMEARFEQVKAKGYKSFLRQELAKSAAQPRGARPMAKKTAAAKAPAAAKRAPARRAATRMAPEARKPAKRGAMSAQQKISPQKGRGSRASSR
jgi:hemerythrin superfamily protein